MLKIEDYNKVQITKIKSWVIYFKYENRYFFLKDDSDEDRHISLIVMALIF